MTNRKAIKENFSAEKYVRALIKKYVVKKMRVIRYLIGHGS